MPRPGTPYSPELRAEAVRRLRSGDATVAQLARELGVSPQTLRRWRHQADARPEGSHPDPQLPVDDREKGRPMRRLAKLTAGAIDVAVTVVTAPATWVAGGLRRYAAQPDEPPPADQAGAGGST